MFSVKKITIRLILVVLLAASFFAVKAIYVPSKRDTALPPEEVTYDITEPTELELLHETDDLKYYYRESRDTIVIYDKRNGYTWKSGTDLPFAKDTDDYCDDILDLYEEQFYNVPVSNFDSMSVFTSLLLTETVIDVNDGVAKAVVVGVDDSFTQGAASLSVSDLNIVNGTQYQVSFDAYSVEPRTIGVNLGTDISETLDLTGVSTTYTYSFTMSEATNVLALLQFDFGYFAGLDNNTTIYLDNILVEEFDGTAIIADTNQVVDGTFDILDASLTTTEADVLETCIDKEVKLNTTYTGFANSLITIEYYDDATNIKRVSSASHSNVDSELMTVTGDTAHYRLDIDFKKQDIEISVHIYFDNEGIRYEVRDEEITGEGTDVLAAIIISPFLGASGGATESFSMDELDYADEETFKYKIPGYSLVPDGAGSLIRFNDNTVKLNDYTSAIYGMNQGQDVHYYNEIDNYVPFKNSSMPVFGIAHGDDQAAFVAFATSGEEYMQIVSMPEENLTYYNFTYPRFEYNKKYFQVYNKSGWGYFSLYEDRNHFDIDIRYNFLSGDGSTSPSADYVGMAMSYREYLLNEGLLTEKVFDYDEIPIRLDFLMSDVEKGITGYNNQVTTNYQGVDDILSDLYDNGITNINSGLLGWNDGGLTLGDPRDTNFTREIGKKSQFESLIETYNQLGIDISFSQDYFHINEEMMPLRKNAAKHTSTWYSRVETFDYPIAMMYYARPVKSIEWMQDQTNVFKNMGVESYTIDGITNNLTSDYTTDMLRAESQEVIIAGFESLGDDHLINAFQPNQYLWQFTDRYLQTPVYTSQFLIETDTVPFLQLVLHNTMEMYGPYSNFSFYTDNDILRMVDYNIYPNFVLTKQPAYLLTDTLSRRFYSTEYNLYEELITHIYTNVDGALGQVINQNWENRTVVSNGVIVNTYSGGTEIVINYTDDVIDYNGTLVEPTSYTVIGG